MLRFSIFVAGLVLGVLVGYLLFGSRDARLERDHSKLEGAVLEARRGEALEAPIREQETRTPEALAVRSEGPRLEDAAAEQPRIDALPSLGTLLYGEARSADGTPIEECSISFTDPEDPRRRSIASVSGGHGYALTGLRPGVWKVYAKPEGHVELSAEVAVLGAPTQRHDLVFEPSFLVTVKLLTPEGKPLREALQAAGFHPWRTEVVVVASQQPFAGDLPMTELRSHDRYGVGAWRGDSRLPGGVSPPLEKGVAGQLELTVPPPVYVAAVFRHAILATAAVAAGQREVILEVSLDALAAKMSTLRLQVVDAGSGAPIPNAHVGLSDAQSGGGGRPTDAEGRIALEKEPVGLLELDVTAQGYERYHRLLRLDPGEQDLGQIRLSPSRKLRILVVDTQGAPVPAAQIQWQNLDRRDFPQPSLHRRSTSTDAEGLAELSGIGDGKYLVQAFLRAGEAKAMRAFHTAEVGNDAVRLELRPTFRIPVGITMPTPRTGLHCLTIYDLERIPVWAIWLRGYAAHVDLPAGSYTWELHDGLELLDQGKLVVGPGESLPRIR